MNKKFDIAVDAYNNQEDFSYRYNGLPTRVQEKIDSGEILANPMTSPDDIIKGGSGGLAERLGSGLPGQVLKVGESGLEWGTAGGGGSDLYEHALALYNRDLGDFGFLLTVISSDPEPMTSENVVSKITELYTPVNFESMRPEVDQANYTLSGFASSGFHSIDDVMNNVFPAETAYLCTSLSVTAEENENGELVPAVSIAAKCLRKTDDDMVGYDGRILAQRSIPLSWFEEGTDVKDFPRKI